MAKRNSTKTATKEALSASQPVVQIFNKWQGISIQNKPVNWLPWDGTEPRDHEQMDLPIQFNAIQNNLELAENGTLETRQDINLLYPQWNGQEFGTAFRLIGGNAYACAGPTLLYWENDAWRKVTMTDADTNAENTAKISEIERFGDTVIVLTRAGEIFTGALGGTDVSSAKTIPTPPSLTLANFTGVGITLSATQTTDCPYRIGFQYVYANRFGTTTGSNKIYFFTNVDSLYMGYDKYIVINQTVNLTTYPGVEEVDIYLLKDDAILASYYGSANTEANGAWAFYYRGAINDTAGFTTHQAVVPTQNTTKGPNASYMTIYDGRAFYWHGTGPAKNRIYIGGNAERPLSIAMGAGSRFIDIEPGLGSFCSNVLKFKTYNGATIITSLFGHTNAYGRQRYNILEINIATSNEVSQQDYMYEQVSNVIGCNSRYGSAVFEDGLYVVDRYGVACTTQAMESSNQLRVVYTSEMINAVFDEMPGYSVDYASMVCINGRVFICLNKSEPDGVDGNNYLDTVILVYDIALKAWYTFTMDNNLKPLRLVSIDYDNDVEGLGIITASGIYRLPTTYPPDQTQPDFNILLQSGEIGVRSPLQQYFYLRQSVLKFDYIIGECTVLLEGVDIYGRKFVVTKNISVPTLERNWSEWMMVEKYILSYNIRIEGPCRFRLVEIQNKTYSTGKKVEIVYGFDDRTAYYGRDGSLVDDHHYLSSYNNLRDAIIT